MLLLAICLIFTLPLLLQHSNMALCQTPSSRESAPEKVSKFARLPSPQPEKARISVLLSVVRQDRDPVSRARAVWDLSDLWTDRHGYSGVRSQTLRGEGQGWQHPHVSPYRRQQ